MMYVLGPITLAPSCPLSTEGAGRISPRKLFSLSGAAPLWSLL